MGMSDVHAVNSNGESALHLLCQAACTPQNIDALVAVGFRAFHIVDGQGMTALHYLASGAQWECIQKMGKLGVSAADGHSNLLHLACSSWRVPADCAPEHQSKCITKSIVELIKLGCKSVGALAPEEAAQVNACIGQIRLPCNSVRGMEKIGPGWSALMCLCWNPLGCVRSIQELAQLGVSPDVVEEDGNTALHLLCGSAYSCFNASKAVADPVAMFMALQDHGFTAWDAGDYAHSE